MNLLKTKEFLDVIEVGKFLAEHYPDLCGPIGSDDSFVGVVMEATSYNYGQDSMAWIEIGEHGEPDESWKGYDDKYLRLVRILERLAADGHIPVRPEYEIYVWW